ncbi:tRNA(fMet)-specific endonuclease VapC [Anatilimnocola aggregata]|uniref:Ribonuclease VapC n=1 Tax=Anatilimnocola aggregata TaxID=2528021 RepID=A0A517Y5A3_9BACT|nr:type II toxin-antitoxin system VapC family toxin [Anatilimnocola aggregata]QDU25418.1 tRNA(fMet)-specific endonuclease VapC [Anatilimnocola aggregata]
MAGKHLLDTNIIIAIFKRDANVLQRLATATEAFVPLIAIGELYYGAQHSAQVQRNMQEVQAFATQSQVLGCDLVTAEIYGQIKNELKAQGFPIPENDVWIAAIARQHDLIVATRDQHFQKVNGLTVESW